ncbi:MAG: hypothetical protein ACRDJV_00780 [Actinomycetota bacterium]
MESRRRESDGTWAWVFSTELVEHIELGFLLDMAEALVVSARARTESHDGHYGRSIPCATTSVS